MLVTKLREKLAPIKIEQPTLSKFFPNLPKLKNHSLLAELERREAFPNSNGYTIKMKRDGTIYIKETHCLICNSRLVKNGYNNRIAILDNGLGKHEFRIQRKRCPRCGEVQPDYSKIAPKYSNYHENYKRRTRQHYMEGLMPSQIQRVFKIDFGILISLSI